MTAGPPEVAEERGDFENNISTMRRWFRDCCAALLTLFVRRFSTKPPCENVGIFSSHCFAARSQPEQVSGTWASPRRRGWQVSLLAEVAVFSELFHLVYFLSLQFKYRHEPEMSLQRQLSLWGCLDWEIPVESAFQGEEASLQPPVPSPAATSPLAPRHPSPSPRPPSPGLCLGLCWRCILGMWPGLPKDAETAHPSLGQFTRINPYQCSPVPAEWELGPLDRGSGSWGNGRPQQESPGHRGHCAPHACCVLTRLPRHRWLHAGPGRLLLARPSPRRRPRFPP